MTGAADPPPVRLGVSSCLLGEEVRYDGRHKRQPFLTEILGGRVEWLPVCPELDIGLGVPREPIHLVTGPGEPRLVGVDYRHDHTDTMRSYAEHRVDTLARTGIDGYVLKSRSPSCGLDVPVHGPDGREVAGSERGRFAAVLVERLPDLPVIQEDQLRAAPERDTFLERVCARHRWRRLAPATADARLDLHRRHELQLEVHEPGAHARLGALIEEAADQGGEAAERYRRELQAVLATPPGRDQHTAVLHRIVQRLGGDPALGELVDRYASGELLWTAVAGAVRDRTSTDAHLAGQTYLRPLAEVGLEPVTW